MLCAVVLLCCVLLCCCGAVLCAVCCVLCGGREEGGREDGEWRCLQKARSPFKMWENSNTNNNDKATKSKNKNNIKETSFRIRSIQVKNEKLNTSTKKDK